MNHFKTAQGLPQILSERLRMREEQRAQREAEDRAAQRERDVIRFKKALKKVINFEAPEDFDDVACTIDGIQLTGAGSSDALRYMSKCTHCGEVVESDSFYHAEYLAEWIRDGKTGTRRHDEKTAYFFCSAKPKNPEPDTSAPEPEPTLGERLESILREIARQEVHQ